MVFHMMFQDASRQELCQAVVGFVIMKLEFWQVDFASIRERSRC